MTTTSSLNITIGDVGYCIEVEGVDYERADPSVGIMRGGFASFTLESAEDDEGNEMGKEALKTLQRVIEADPSQLSSVLSALDEAAQADAEDADIENWRWGRDE